MELPLPQGTFKRTWGSSISSPAMADCLGPRQQDRKSTRLNSSHGYISYAVFCLKKKKRISPKVFVMAATETITSIILIKLIRFSLAPVSYTRRFKIVVIYIKINMKKMLRDIIGIRVNRAKKSGMVNITSSVNSMERSGINTILHDFFFF